MLVVAPGGDTGGFVLWGVGMFNRIVALLLFIICFARVCFAEPARVLDVSVVHLLSSAPGACDERDIREVVRIAKDLLAPAIKVRFTMYSLQYDMIEAFYINEALENRIKLDRLSKDMQLTGRTQAHFVTPPWRATENPIGRYTGGLAPICARSASMSSCVSVNSLGDARIRQAGVAMAHEILHTIGGLHTFAEGGLMSYTAIEESTRIWPLLVEGTTRRRIKACGRVRVRR